MTNDIGRRSFLGATIGAVLAAGASSLRGQSAAAGSAPRTKGPIVWMGMDQKELDDAYDQNVYAPNRRQVQGRMHARSATMPERLGAPLHFSYGPTAFEALDVFRTGRPNAPVNIFVHGGAWRGGSAEDNWFLAELFVRAGAHSVILDFINVLQADGNLMTMAEQVRRAVAWVYRNARSFGGDANQLYITGHSSGGHLAGVALTTDWRALGLPADTIKGAVLASGMYDLKAPRLSKRGSYVKLTDEIERALSPQRHVDVLDAPVTLVYGTEETPEFQRQSRDFAAAVRAAGKPAALLVADNCNHFEVLETLGNPYGWAGRAALEMMKIGKA